MIALVNMIVYCGGGGGRIGCVGCGLVGLRRL